MQCRQGRQTSIIGGTWQGIISPEEQLAHKRRNDSKLAVECASNGRCFFITEGGRLGIGPPTLRPGDAVYILHGSRVPMILRSSGTSRTCREKVMEKLVLSTDEAQAKFSAGDRNRAETAPGREASKVLGMQREPSRLLQSDGRCLRSWNHGLKHDLGGFLKDKPEEE